MQKFLYPLHSSLSLRLLAFVLSAVTVALGQQQGEFTPIPRFDLPASSIEISQRSIPREPFSVAGETGAIFGQQDGTFELWRFPIKVLAHFHITAELADYPVPIDLNSQAAAISVSPDHTTITYSHAAITVKQHMFVTRETEKDSPGAIVLFEIHSVRSAVLTIQFQPVMQRQWPAPNFASSGSSWMKLPGGGGAYVLSTDNPRLYGIVAMPRTQPGILAPYQERPKYYPTEFKLTFDPKRDDGLFFPLIALVSDGSEPLSDKASESVSKRLAQVASKIPTFYSATRSHYENFLKDRIAVQTPDSNFDKAMKWAEVSVEQMKAVKGSETGLVAGWYSSGDSARPGFGWFFGRDTLWSLYAVHSYGDFAVSRQALEFLINRQRADGKIMHEYSQTADQVDWASLPYQFAAADSTPLFIMVMQDYLRSTGDLAFIKKYWPNLKNAYQFTRSHDSDGDGIYDNSQGTGWVESWPPGMPQQELYLASLDQQSCEAMSRLAREVGEDQLAASAHNKAEEIRNKLNGYLGRNGIYAFSRNRDGSLDSTPTVFPTVAWWTGTLSLPQAEKSFELWASSNLSTDWGVRAVGTSSPLFDPISYHQGSVWPLFTGWTSLAEYRTGRTLSGYAHLRQNLDLTWEHDPGAVTELLSGTFNEPLGRSTAHQLWSSAMILAPALRGLFGIESDFSKKNLRIQPALPANWDFAKLHNVPFGDSILDIEMRRERGTMTVRVTSEKPLVLCLNTLEPDKACSQPANTVHATTVSLPALEVYLPEESVAPGAVTSQVKVLQQKSSSRTLELLLEAPANSQKTLMLRINSAKRPKVSVQGARIDRDVLTVTFPPGSGYQRASVAIEY